MHHDSGYRNLFSHPRMIEDLLRGFVDEIWLEELDFSTLERWHSSHVTRRLQRREQDMVWRLRRSDPNDADGDGGGRGGDWLYLYVALEFQSRSERFMALRMLTYTSLLYEDLVRQGALTPGGRLPPVLPLVLYNGPRPWRAALDVAELVEAAGHPEARPSLRYWVVDVGRLSVDTGTVENLMAALGRLEQAASPGEVKEVVDDLASSLRGETVAEMRRAFAAWIRDVLLPVRSTGSIEWQADLESLEDLQVMLRERVIQWTQEWKEEGLQKGRAEGERRLLRRQLERRYGSLPERWARALAEAGEDDLLRWSERILDAESLDEVFA